jgi:hypothetical protein
MSPYVSLKGKRWRETVARKSREKEIIGAIRKFLTEAVKGLEPITDERLINAAGCARATYYKYVTKGSAIQAEIEAASVKQKKYAEKANPRLDNADQALRKRLEKSEEGNRELLAFISRMTANLIKYGVPSETIQAAQREAMSHPDRSFSHTGKGRRRN